MSDVQLHQERRQERSGIKICGDGRGRPSSIGLKSTRDAGCVMVCGEVRQILPKELAPVEYPAASHVKQVHGQHSVFKVVPEHIRVIALGSSDPLFLL